MAGGSKGGAWSVVIVVAAALSGCTTAPLVSLDEWTLRAQNETPAAIHLPARLDRTLVPARIKRFSLSTRVELPAQARGAELELVIPNLAGVRR